MARPREFDTDMAVGRAVDVFWEHGYDGASLPDLLTGMGIARGSLYKAFTDKKTLFLLALERYDRDAVAPAVELLCDPKIADGWERIRLLFETAVDAARDGDRRGCLMCMAAAGPAAVDPDVAAQVDRMLDRMRGGFAAGLAASQGHAWLGEDAAGALADLLTTHYVGLRVLARSQAPVAALERSAAALGDFLA